jgi:hypothetical protein
MAAEPKPERAGDPWLTVGPRCKATLKWGTKVLMRWSHHSASGNMSEHVGPCGCETRGGRLPRGPCLSAHGKRRARPRPQLGREVEIRPSRDLASHSLFFLFPFLLYFPFFYFHVFKLNLNSSFEFQLQNCTLKF